jgi:holo-[acyl-carrier protein] synthase
MLRTGVDIIEIARVERVMSRSGPRFLARIFTAQEQAYCRGRMASLAGRFAVKEAVAKALGTGIGEMTWVEIEVVSDESGRPELVLHGAAKRLADELGLREWSISLSHTETYAIGFAAAMGKTSI